MSARQAFSVRATHEIHYRSLFNVGRGMSFPCDATGWVNLNTLSERERVNYLAARALVGREFAAPAVLAVLHDEPA